MKVQLPPNVTMHGSFVAPAFDELRLHDLWHNTDTGKTFRYVLSKDGEPSWEPFDLATLEKTDQP